MSNYVPVANGQKANDTAIDLCLRAEPTGDTMLHAGLQTHTHTQRMRHCRNMHFSLWPGSAGFRCVHAFEYIGAGMYTHTLHMHCTKQANAIATCTFYLSLVTAL